MVVELVAYSAYWSESRNRKQSWGVHFETADHMKQTTFKFALVSDFSLSCQKFTLSQS